MLEPVRPIFRALASTVVPEATRLDERSWSDVEAIVERALAERPRRMQRQIVLLLRVIEFLPLLTVGRRFTALDEARRTALLTRLGDSGVLLLRRGIWGVRTLAFMGYYARAEAGAEIGYAASPRGWLARGRLSSPATKLPDDEAGTVAT